ncbi:MAG: alpha/beta fold hydrolase [Gallionellaceae bacterium]
MQSLKSNSILQNQLKLGARHQPSRLNSTFSVDQKSFSGYIADTRTMIARARNIIVNNQVDIDTPQPELGQIIEGNSPFELTPENTFQSGKNKPYRRGVLLIHGLSDSPYFMRHLGNLFRENGFRVMAILLPGHGTQPGDLLQVRWHEWVKAVAFGVDQLAKEVDDVYLAGFSAGGALSVHQSYIDQRIKGLFLFAPALQISPKAALANLHKASSWLLPSTKWISIHPDWDCYKYESFSKNAAAQIHALTRVINKQIKQNSLTLPIFSVVSQDDTTVNTPATLKFMMQAQHPANKLIYYFSDAGSIPDWHGAGQFEAVNGVFPDAGIIGSAHTAIVLPAKDEYYGVNGNYRNCLHYLPNRLEDFITCQQDKQQTLFGEITTENLGKGLLCRLMYNPSFSALQTALQQFIARLDG